MDADPDQYDYLCSGSTGLGTLVSCITPHPEMERPMVSMDQHRQIIRALALIKAVPGLCFAGALVLDWRKVLTLPSWSFSALLIVWALIQLGTIGYHRWFAPAPVYPDPPTALTRRQRVVVTFLLLSAILAVSVVTGLPARVQDLLFGR
jgi:hypothetical protein